MSFKEINENPVFLRKYIDNRKETMEQYQIKHPDSLVPLFEAELRNLGFVFEISDQIHNYLPEHKDVILPITIKYYNLAKKLKKDNEQNHFLSYFRYKGFIEVIPTLLEDYYSSETTNLTQWFISDCLYEIRSKKYVDEYLKIIANSTFKGNRIMLIRLVGQFKTEKAIPILIDLLEDEMVRLHAIYALGCFKREEFRCHFERFQDDKRDELRKSSRQALAKLDKQREKLHKQ